MDGISCFEENNARHRKQQVVLTWDATGSKECRSFTARLIVTGQGRRGQGDIQSLLRSCSSSLRQRQVRSCFEGRSPLPCLSPSEKMVRCPKCPSAMELPPNVARPGTVRCPCGHQFCSDCLAHPHPTHPCMMRFNSTKVALSGNEKQSVVDGFLRNLADRQWTLNAHQRTVLAEGQTGFGLIELIQPYLDSLVKTIQLDEPYLSSKTQMGRLVEFFGVVMRKAAFLESIKLKTCPCKKEEARTAQAEQLDKIRISLAKRSVALEITYVKGLHDREVRIDNGWIIKIGRGLDFHKASSNKNSIDEMESSFRQCRATIVDAIFKPLP